MATLLKDNGWTSATAFHGYTKTYWNRDIAYPRQIAMYLSRKLTEEPLINIGSYFGGRDHTTVMHAFNKIEEDLKGSQGDELRKSLEDMKRRITGE